jgi:hypothetical protein
MRRRCMCQCHQAKSSPVCLYLSFDSNEAYVNNSRPGLLSRPISTSSRPDSAKILCALRSLRFTFLSSLTETSCHVRYAPCRTVPIKSQDSVCTDRHRHTWPPDAVHAVKIASWAAINLPVDRDRDRRHKWPQIKAAFIHEMAASIIDATNIDRQIENMKTWQAREAPLV